LSNLTILVTSRSFSSGKKDFKNELAAAGYRVVVGDFSHELDKLKKDLAVAVAWIAGVAEITEAHLSEAKNLKIIARYGVGIDAVDLASAKARGIAVTNTPGANSLAVAEHSLALLLSSARHVHSSFQKVLKNNWQVVRGSQISGSHVGVIGFGKIGRLVTEKLVSLGAKVSVSDPYINSHEISKFGATKVELEEIKNNCKFVLLQAPGGQKIIDAPWLSTCLSNQVIINTARADLVDEKALADALDLGKLNFYAADALQDELNSPLLRDNLREKVLITAHIAAQTDEAIDKMSEMAVANILRVLSGEPAVNPVL
jgi:D-3-phosphoglycerate dehydrogenase